MIGYITKVSSFGALARYLQSSTGRSPERRVLWTTARYVSGDLQKAAAEMNLTRHLAETEALGYHLTIGYDPTDQPTRAEMEYAVKRTLGALGLGDNMAITVAHGDAYFAHSHTMVARWDYWTARVVEASNSYYVITRVMRELEKKLGMEPAPRPYWERTGREREGGRVEGSSTRLTEHFPIALRNRARSALQSATSWSQLQALLREDGLRYVRGRDNLLVARGETTIRAGQITGGTSLAKLEARFGQTLREYEAEVAGRLIEADGDEPQKEKRQFRKGGATRAGGATGKRAAEEGRKREGEEKQAEDLLLALAGSFRRREEAYQLTRRSALFEAEEADVSGLQQDLRKIEMRGTALLEGMLRSGGSASQQSISSEGSGGSNREGDRRLKDQALDLWRAAARNVEHPENTRSLTPESLRRILGEKRAVRITPEKSKRLFALLEEHRRAAGQATVLFGSEGERGGKQVRRERGQEKPWNLWETETSDEATSLEAASPSTESYSEEVYPEGQSQKDGVKILVGPLAETPPAEELLTKTREAIQEARLGLEKRLRELQRQVQDGKGTAELERTLCRLLGRLADRDPEAASRFARRYVLEEEEKRESGAEGRGESESILEGGSLERENLQSPAVQEALRRALPEGVQMEGRRGPQKESPSRSR
ncbi:hypothetical protein BSZ35_18950 [Salinibacter sp. 10B]|uniref:relaxase/mobilization nuclease domain-containing protein n=1 Tax=Salinibacter sp. 10B TaxID=1923971 RepID=UPI000CF3D901|nr:relaxase/mobilization nuclease domain-containing protein [Salinibacter sp. 10B]PQJ26994.1 hypothetical protein BSZ35_18950 [Salinibacter sp. 10B]